MKLIKEVDGSEYYLLALDDIWNLNNQSRKSVYNQALNRRSKTVIINYDIWEDGKSFVYVISEVGYGMSISTSSTYSVFISKQQQKEFALKRSEVLLACML